jgi:hypothetical protein
MKKVAGEHTGKNISKYIMKILKEYNIKNNLGYFVIDNAPDNNNNIISSFATRIQTNL